MQILTDSFVYAQQVQEFLRDFCPEHLKAEILVLLAAEDWERLDQMMQPFYNTPA